VVSNPILDRTFVAPNGTSFRNPIHDNAWASLKALQADLVRFVPWFPYPKKSVAELDAPSKSKTRRTSWDFSHILPQLEDFMDAVYGQNHTVVLNFATQPCWLFGDAENKTQNCSYLKTQMSRSSATCVVIGKTCWIPVEKLWLLTLDDFSPIL
jgi:hypothetical protein